MPALLAPLDGGVHRVGGRPGTAEGPERVAERLPPDVTLLRPPLEGRPEDYDRDRERLADAVAQSAHEGLVVIGGDHGITHAVVAGLRRADLAPAIVYIDPHWDLRTWRPHTSGSSFRRIVDEGLVPGEAIHNLGHQVPRDAARIRTDDDLTQVAKRLGLSHVPMHALKADPAAAARGLDLPAGYHLSVDVDALDQTVAPGVSAPGPDRLTMEELNDILDALPDPGSADIVEYAPRLDEDDRTLEATVHITRRLLGLVEVP